MATHQKKYQKNKGNSELVLKGDNQEYAEVLKSEGDGFTVQPLEGGSVLARLIGKLKKGPHKQYIVKGDFVLIEKDMCTTEKDKFYIIHKYKEDEQKQLKKQGQLRKINVIKKDDAIKDSIQIGDGDDDNEEELDDTAIDNI